MPSDTPSERRKRKKEANKPNLSDIAVKVSRRKRRRKTA